MSAAVAVVAFAAGYYLSHLMNCWGAMYRRCCREHYATHATCRCADCQRDRELAA